MSDIVRTLSNHFGEVKNLQSLSGGDINDVFSFESNDQKYCLKVNHAQKFPNMFQAEAKGLEVLRKNGQFLIPKVVKQFSEDVNSYLVLEFIDSSDKSSNYPESFAQKLHALHSTSHHSFGLNHNNYIGSLSQENHFCDTWSAFYATHRLQPLAKICFDKGLFTKKQINSLDRLCRSLDQIFPTEPPSLLHGDLWNGNTMPGTNGQICIYDPAVYFGHREMDLGMMKLFGGFEDAIFRTYEEITPLEANWEQRIKFTQLYPLLVHSILLGSSYIPPIDKTLKSF